MIHHITVVTPGNRDRNKTLLRMTDLPIVSLYGVRQINAVYKHWGLSR